MPQAFVQELNQTQNISQQQVLSLKILTLNNYDLKQLISQEEMENPLLEVSTPGESDTLLPEYAPSYEGSIRSSSKSCTGAGERADAFSFIAAIDYSNYDIFLPQLDLSSIGSVKTELLKTLIDYMDDNGYIRYMPEELSAILATPVDLIRECLHIIQHLHPYGSGAYDLAHCLRLQLEAYGLMDDTAACIIQNHLDDIANHKYQNIALALNITKDSAVNYARRIRSLNPRPLNGLTKGQHNYIVPDIIFHKEEQQWTAFLNDSWMGTLRLNEYYMNLDQTYWDNNTRNYFYTHKNQAVFISNCIEQRRSTLIKLSNYILFYQMDFFESGRDLKPLTMKQVADAIGLHESTVSRAIKDKYVQTPSGTYLLKTLLPASIRTNTHIGMEDLSAPHIKKILMEILNSENRSAPYNDGQLSALLRTRGIGISRRTIAKYRGELNVPTAQQRKYM